MTFKTQIQQLTLPLLIELFLITRIAVIRQINRWRCDGHWATLLLLACTFKRRFSLIFLRFLLATLPSLLRWTLLASLPLILIDMMRVMRLTASHLIGQELPHSAYFELLLWWWRRCMISLRWVMRWRVLSLVVLRGVQWRLAVCCWNSKCEN